MKTNSSIAEKLRAYSALAGVVAVTPFAAQAQIIYTNVEPDIIVTSGNSYGLDLNGDGVSDFEFKVKKSWSAYSSTNLFMPSIIAPNSNYFQSKSYYPAKLISGDTIKPSMDWGSGSGDLWYYNPLWGGSGFLGLKFQFNSKELYGWARITISDNGETITVHDFAYNNISDSTIVVGKTTCLTSTPQLPEITQSGDTLLAHGEGISQWKLNGNPVSGLNDTILPNPIQGFNNVIFIDTFGCNIQSLPINFLKCDSIDKSIRTTSANIYCGKESIQLLFNYPKPGFTYQWEKNNLKIPGATNSSYKTAIDSSSDFRVIISPQLHGCYDSSAILHFTIFPLPPPPVVTQHLDTLWSSLQSNYQWNLRVCPYGCYDSTISGATEQFYLPPKDKNGNYSVTYIDTNGCMSVGRKSFDHCYYFKPPRYISALPKESVCAGDTVTLLGPVGNYKYQWIEKNIGDYFSIGGNISGATNNEYKTSESGTYFLRLDSTTCTLNSNEIEVSIDVSPISVMVFQNGETLIASAAFNYQWYYPDGTEIPGATNQSYAPSADGFYSIEVKNEGGCLSKKAIFNFRKCHH